MKRIGIILLVLGLVGFVLASSQRAGYDTVEGGIKSVFSSEERSKKEGWETGALGVDRPGRARPRADGRPAKT